MNRMFLLGGAALACAAAAVMSVAPAFAWDSVIEGHPAALEAGGLNGVYFWHEGDGLHLYTTDAHDNGHLYTGTLTTDGVFENLQRDRLEQEDQAEIATPQQLTFSFHTFDGLDGISFQIAGGSQVTLSLALDGSPLGVDSTFLGAYSQHPDSNPFTVTRAGGGPPPPPPGQNPIIGAPKSFDAGSSAGVYFWKQGELHLATTDPENVEHHYTGIVVTDGSVENVKPVKLESDDYFAVTGLHNDELDFDFHTFSGIDGVGFHVKNGSYAIVTLYRDGSPLPVDHIFLGAYSQHPDSDPFTADIN